MNPDSGKVSKLYMSSKNRKMSRLFLYLAGILILLMNISPCLATYYFEGVPDNSKLKEVTSGTIKGGLYVDAGKGAGLHITPYTEEFNVPGSSVKWARVYVGVWGGTEAKYGTLDLTVNGEEFDTVDLEGNADSGDDKDQNPAIYCSGHGVYWVAYDVGTNVSTGPVKVEADTSGTIDGRVYGIVLVAVYEDEKDGQDTKYWVEEGNINLHGKGWSGGIESTHEEAYADFSKKVDVDEYKTANLAVVYLCGSPGLEDSLYFNDEQLSDGGNKNDIANSKNYFDFKFFDVLDFLENKDNSLTFKRDNEDYLHPVLATLCLGTEEDEGSDLTVSGLTLPTLYAGKDNTIKAEIKNIGEKAYGFQAALYADDELVSTASVSSLQKDKSKTIEFSWKPNCDGEKALKVYVDHMDKKKEICEVNNWNTPIIARIIDRTPPEIEIEAPEDGSLVNTNYLTVSGTVEDTNRNLTVDVNGQEALLSGDSWSAEMPVVSGSNKIVVSAVDGANNTGREFIVVNGKASLAPNLRTSVEPGNKTKPANQTDSLSRQDKSDKDKSDTKQIGLPKFYGVLGLIATACFLRLQSRRKQA